jgi:hypothetical protein
MKCGPSKRENITVHDKQEDAPGMKEGFVVLITAAQLLPTMKQGSLGKILYTMTSKPHTNKTRKTANGPFRRVHVT